MIWKSHDHVMKKTQLLIVEFMLRQQVWLQNFINFFCYRTPQLNVFSMTQIWHLILCSLAYCTSHIAYYVDVLPCSCCAIVWTCGMAHGSMPDQSRAGNRTIYKYNASSLQTTAKSKKGTRTCCYMYIRQIISNFRFLFSICTCTM